MTLEAHPVRLYYILGHACDVFVDPFKVPTLVVLSPAPLHLHYFEMSGKESLIEFFVSVEKDLVDIISSYHLYHETLLSWCLDAHYANTATTPSRTRKHSHKQREHLVESLEFACFIRRS